MSKKLITIIILTGLLGPSAMAQTADRSSSEIDLITVIGTRTTQEIAGAVTYLGTEELQEYQYTDINRVLRAVPGVNLQEEDGFGLRPNIGLRGSGTDRSSKILILEDGVPVAPAPFSAPSAYYFPMTARMSGVEITKGVGAVKYGPITTAGTLQFFSTPIPDEPAFHLNLLTSDLGRTTGHLWAGRQFETTALPFTTGILVETLQDQAQGFKKIAVGKTGFDIKDYVGKIGFYSKENAAFQQNLIVKGQHSEETSNETYLGLSPEDFNRIPYARYSASQLDQMNTEHDLWQATHNIEFRDNITLTTLAYQTKYHRNWEKLDRFDNSQLSGLSVCNSLNEILADIATCGQEYLVLVAPDNYSSPDDVLGIRQNNRRYKAQGIQSALTVEFETGDWSHQLQSSIRYHQDEVSRFQEQDQYKVENGLVVKTTDNAPGSQANRFSQASSLALYIEDQVKTGNWRFTGGARIEKVETEQSRWNTPDRSLSPDSQRENSHDIFLPSVGLAYEYDEDLTLFAGIYQGFALPSPSTRASDGTENEQSTSYEFGGKYDNGTIQWEAIGYFNDYDNLLAECTNSTGGSECDIGDNENAGAAQTYGLELQAGSDLSNFIDSGVSIPVGITYSWTQTELKSSVTSDIFGDVTVGDEIPYVPEHQLTLRLAVEGDRWHIGSSTNYVSQARDVPGQGPIAENELIGERTITDLSAWIEVNERLKLTAKVDNVFDETYLAARRPYGLRPGKPREVFAGLTADF
ncbi:MAG: TonB-dependent receptor family protein [bacterium]